MKRPTSTKSGQTNGQTSTAGGQTDTTSRQTSTMSFFYLFHFYLFNNLFKVDKFTKIQYTYIHKNSQTNWLIKVNYPILQKKSSNLLIKKKKSKTGL